MKRLRDGIANTLCTFTVLSVLFGTLCLAGVLDDLPSSEVIFPLLLISAGTSAFILLREWLLPGAGNARHAIDITGCTVIVFLTLRMAGWLERRFSYFLLVFAMILAVYLAVWLLTWLQCKHDEGDLNALLRDRAGKRSDASRK